MKLPAARLAAPLALACAACLGAAEAAQVGGSWSLRAGRFDRGSDSEAESLSLAAAAAAAAGANLSDVSGTVLGRPIVEQTLLRLREVSRAGQPAPAWTSTEPDSTDYNPETPVAGMPFSVETIIAFSYCLMLASAPLLLASLSDDRLTRAHMLESVALIAWLGGVIFLFTNVLKFQSSHWDGYRPLTLVEAVYLLSQILTTVGYGDITPAFPRGQVWVGFNVILALCLYGSTICEVTELIHAKVRKAMHRGQESRSQGQPLKDWQSELHTSSAHLVRSACFFAGITTVGVLFWHFYPGEEKTWLQAIYMSVITLSTVGFGAFNATTEGGKVFGAFWMLVGVASLGALISTFIETMLHEKQAERRREADVGAELRQCVEKVCGDRDKMNKAEFLKFALMLTKKTDPKHLLDIERRFGSLVREKDGPFVRRTVLADSWGPPL